MRERLPEGWTDPSVRPATELRDYNVKEQTENAETQRGGAATKKGI